jgi:hypothetical protein
VGVAVAARLLLYCCWDKIQLVHTRKLFTSFAQVHHLIPVFRIRSFLASRSRNHFSRKKFVQKSSQKPSNSTSGFLHTCICFAILRHQVKRVNLCLKIDIIVPDPDAESVSLSISTKCKDNLYIFYEIALQRFKVSNAPLFC